MEERDIIDNRIQTRISGRDVKNLLGSTVKDMAKGSFRMLSLISPEMATDLAWKKFTTPTRRPRLVNGRSFTPDRIKQLKLVGEEISVYEFGTPGKPNILLVHGWEGRALDFTEFIQPLVEAGYHVVVFDGPAHGESSGKQTHAPQFAELISALHDFYSGFHALIGHSFGGFAVSLAASQEEKLRQSKIVTIGTPNSLERIFSEFVESFDLHPGLIKELMGKVQNLFGFDPNKVATAHFLNEANVPTLIVHDMNDKQVPYRVAEEMHDSVAHAGYITTVKLGHHRILRCRELSNSILEFLI